MAETATCDRCGTETQQYELEKTSDGYLCSDCAEEHLAGQAGEMGPDLGTAGEWFVGIAVIAGLVVVAVKVPDGALENAGDASDAPRRSRAAMLLSPTAVTTT